jgi:hypothetical protein
MRKVLALIVSGFLLLNITGCFAIIAGSAAGGTAYWLSGKLSQTMNASFDKTVSGTRAALKSMDLPLDSELVKKEIAQFKSKWTDGTEIWIDIKPVTTATTQVDIRVGAASSNKVAASDIMKHVEQRV